MATAQWPARHYPSSCWRGCKLPKLACFYMRSVHTFYPHFSYVQLWPSYLCYLLTFWVEWGAWLCHYCISQFAAHNFSQFSLSNHPIHCLEGQSKANTQVLYSGLLPVIIPPEHYCCQGKTPGMPVVCLKLLFSSALSHCKQLRLAQRGSSWLQEKHVVLQTSCRKSKTSSSDMLWAINNDFCQQV